MKNFFTFLAMAALAIGTMTAQWVPSDTESTRLDAEGAQGQTQMQTLRTDDGKIILTWLRGERVNDYFSYQLHLQLFDANGNAMFGDEGIVVCDKPTRSWTTAYALALAPNGDILIAYNDIRNDLTGDNSEAFLYRYTQQGEPVWGADGILFNPAKFHENAFAIEDASLKLCVSGDNIYFAATHIEYYMEEANEDNWSPSPWFPNQEMPDSVQLDDSAWMIVKVSDDGSFSEPMRLNSTICTMDAAPEGNIYLVYDNKENYGLDAQLLNNELTNVWEAPVTVEQRAISSGSFVPTPITAVNEDNNLMLTYRVLASFYGYQVVNQLTPEGVTASEAVSCNNSIDGDAGSASMGVKENRAMVAWEWAYSASENHMNVNVIDDDNNFFWNGDLTYGLSLETNDMWGFTPVKVIPISVGWVVLYGNCTSWNGANFMVVKIDEFGNILSTKQICEDNFKSNGFAVTYDENNAYIFYTQDPQYDDNWNEIPGSGGMFVMCVDINGKPSSIEDVQTSDEIVKTEIFTLDGRPATEMSHGVYIVRKTDANGNVTSTKVMK